jgi:hypothetical protein
MSQTNTQSTLLDYAFDTVPYPLQASPGTGDPVMAVLTLIVSNSTRKAVTLSSITVILPIGDGANNLTTINNAPSIMASADPERLWNVSSTTTLGVFIIQPVSGQPITITDTGVVFQFFNITVNTAPGTFIINIIEVASQTAELPPPPPPPLSISLTKFPYGFFFNNLVANLPAVNNGGTVTLTWQGSTQAKYFMLFNDQTIDVSNLRSWTSPPLQRDTTFLLKAISISDQERVERGLSTTVNVYNPNLQPASVSVGGDITVNGAMSVLGSSNIADVQVNGYFLAVGGGLFKDLTISDYTYLQGPTQVSGDLVVGGNISAYGMPDIKEAKTADQAMALPGQEQSNSQHASAKITGDITQNDSAATHAGNGRTGEDSAPGSNLLTGDVSVKGDFSDTGKVNGFEGNFTYLNVPGMIRTPSTESPLIQCQTGYFGNTYIGSMMSQSVSINWWTAWSNDQNELLLNLYGQTIIKITPAGKVSITPYQGTLPPPFPPFSTNTDGNSWKVPANEKQE